MKFATTCAIASFHFHLRQKEPLSATGQQRSRAVLEDFITFRFIVNVVDLADTQPRGYVSENPFCICMKTWLCCVC